MSADAQHKPHDRTERLSGRKLSLHPVGGPRVENTDYGAFLKRAVRALGRRVAAGDVEDLAELVALRQELDEATAEAVRGLRAEPSAASWQAIADVLGITRQAAMQRWPDVGGARRPGGQPAALR